MKVQNKIADLLPGQKVGRWTLQERFLDPEKGYVWRCRCDCSTERSVRERSLRYGASSSCGCLRKGSVLQKESLDLTNRRFGELTVLHKADKAEGNAANWVCKCDCGDECTVLEPLLLTGRKTCCSSAKHRKYAYADITGQSFGKLTALSVTGERDKNGYLIWKCKCACGRVVDVSYNKLVYTSVQSCGCQKKEHSQKLQSYLTHVAGTSVDMLKSKKIPADNTTGYKGVYFIRGKYVAKIVFQKKQYILGKFDAIEDAAEARKEAEKVLFDSVADHYEKWKCLAKMDPVWAENHPVKIQVSFANQKLSVTLLPDIYSGNKRDD